MKIKQTILLLLFISGHSLMAQTVKHWAGIANTVDPENQYNNATCSIADARFYSPEGLGWDKNGNFWIVENNKVRLFYNNQFYNRAGQLGPGNFSQSYITNKAGNQAAFYAPTSIVGDANGDMFIVDSENHAIRKLEAFTSTGQQQQVTTFAGAMPITGNQGNPGYKDGTTTAALFDKPKGIARDASGNFYVTEFNNFTIRKITSGGVVSTLAGKGGEAGSTNGTGNGTTARFGGPYGIAVYDANYLIVSDFDNGMIRKIKMSDGTVVQNWGVAGDNGIVDGNFTNARFLNPRGVAVVDGNIYVCDRNVIRVIDIAKQTVSTFAGDKNVEGNKDGKGAAAAFGTLSGIAYDGKISLYVTDIYYNVIKIVTIDNLAPTVDFTADNTKPVFNKDVVVLTNNSTGKPGTSFKWTITPGMPNYSVVAGSETSSSVSVKFSVVGFYEVKLDVTNAFGVGTLSKKDYIQVSTVGISKLNNDISMGVFPNPSEGIFTLQSLNGNFPVQSILVTDVTGKVVLQKICYNSVKEDIDLSASQSGIYFLKVMTASGYNTLKLYKL